MRPSPKNHELFQEAESRNRDTGTEKVVTSRRNAYKGGRRLAGSITYEQWRTRVDLSHGEIAAKMEKEARESSKKRVDLALLYKTGRTVYMEPIVFPEGYLKTKSMEVEYGRFKPAYWFMKLFDLTFPDVNIPWWEFMDGIEEGR